MQIVVVHFVTNIAAVKEIVKKNSDLVIVKGVNMMRVVKNFLVLVSMQAKNAIHLFANASNAKIKIYYNKVRKH